MKDKPRSIIENWKTVSSSNVNWKIPMIKAWHLKKKSHFLFSTDQYFYEEGGL